MPKATNTVRIANDLDVLTRRQKSHTAFEHSEALEDLLWDKSKKFLTTVHSASTTADGSTSKRPSPQGWPSFYMQLYSRFLVRQLLPNNTGQKSHYSKRRRHNKHAHQSPQHVLFAFVCIVRPLAQVPQKLHQAVQEYD